MNSIVQASPAATQVASGSEHTMYAKLLSSGKHLNHANFVPDDKATFDKYLDKVYIKNKRTGDICNAVAALSGLEPVKKSEASLFMYQLI